MRLIAIMAIVIIMVMMMMKMGSSRWWWKWWWYRWRWWIDGWMVMMTVSGSQSQLFLATPLCNTVSWWQLELTDGCCCSGLMDTLWTTDGGYCPLPVDGGCFDSSPFLSPFVVVWWGFSHGITCTFIGRRQCFGCKLEPCHGIVSQWPPFPQSLSIHRSAWRKHFRKPYRITRHREKPVALSA